MRSLMTRGPVVCAVVVPRVVVPRVVVPDPVVVPDVVPVSGPGGVGARAPVREGPVRQDMRIARTRCGEWAGRAGVHGGRGRRGGRYRGLGPRGGRGRLRFRCMFRRGRRSRGGFRRGGWLVGRYAVMVTAGAVAHCVPDSGDRQPGLRPADVRTNDGKRRNQRRDQRQHHNASPQRTDPQNLPPPNPGSMTSIGTGRVPRCPGDAGPKGMNGKTLIEQLS